MSEVMAEKVVHNTPKTVLVLGGSYAGISAAHNFLRNVLPSLPDKASYNVTLVNTSSHFYSRPTAPRGVVSEKLHPFSKAYYDIAQGFAKYPAGQFTFLEGTATSFDPAIHTVGITLPNKQVQTITYHALVIATGTAPTWVAHGIHTTHQLTQESQKAFHAALPNAKTIVVAGGGPAGVETAGELGHELNGLAGMFSSAPKDPKVKITIVTSGTKLLPALRPAIAKKAEKILAKMGVNVIYGTKVESVLPVNAGNEDPATLALDGVTAKTTVTLSNGETIEADLYIPAMGVKPNTQFVPKHFLSEKGYINNNAKTLRIDEAGPNVYAVGDVATYCVGGVMDIYSAIPVLGENMKRDLLGDKATGADKQYSPNKKETQLVPIGRSKGVGAMFGWKLPSFFVWMIKGRDYFAGMAQPVVDGSKWGKIPK
ncbi:Serine/threonine-protein kinase bur1 [Venturia nashicola]|uniref:Serine/threonine-protein kinase bur1 n=1 Tax=Venturia nashicola TaxID=86259 RepID=A0A4Z1P117_9PEZI|nr:Serine/threonine-protein kinase bur1 [Venturia nashicola]TLD30270.1 Serine/threonine-protein kinase bur1 [Venturia nashicola]